MDKLINGIYETMRTFGYVEFDEFGYCTYKKEAFDFGKKIFEILHSTIKEFTKGKDYKANIEQIPGESCAVKFKQADTLLYPEKVIDDLPLYLNQWIPLGINSTLQERIKICSTFDKYCDGGSIMHINIDAPFDSEEKAWEMLNYIAKKGVTYFAFNPVLCKCEDDHLFHGNICTKCGKPKTDEFTRTVGFFTNTNTWSKERKDEFSMRKWLDLNQKPEDGED